MGEVTGTLAVVYDAPLACHDRRGDMWPWYNADWVMGRSPARPSMQEGTVAISHPGVLRGIHYALNRAKYVTCLVGEVYDVAVDLRQDSPTFGDWEAHRLSESNRKAVYLREGLGHACLSLTHSVVAYLYDTPYDAKLYQAINPLDPDIGINWPWVNPILSDKDAAAPPLGIRRPRPQL